MLDRFGTISNLTQRTQWLHAIACRSRDGIFTNVRLHLLKPPNDCNLRSTVILQCSAFNSSVSWEHYGSNLMNTVEICDVHCFILFVYLRGKFDLTSICVNLQWLHAFGVDDLYLRIPWSRLHLRCWQALSSRNSHRHREQQCRVQISEFWHISRCSTHLVLWVWELQFF